MVIAAIALVLQLHDFSGAPPAVLAGAQRELTRVYADIGVPVEWVSDNAGAARTAMHVIVVDRESGVLRQARDTVLGATIWTGNRTPAIYIFYSRVEAEARRHGVSLPLVLACALAHELGHVLMPDGGHSRDGLMRACWNRGDFHDADRGRLRFRPEQVKEIRAAAGR